MMDWKKIGMTELFLLSILISANIAVLNASVCTRLSKSCKRSADCCDGCCIENICTKSEKCMMEDNPCSLHLCPPTTVCRLQKVHCVRAPCAPIPICKPTSDIDK